jgi:uncharacterized protein
MLLVETFVGPSKIEGVGVFAVSRIRKGTKLWAFHEAFDHLIPESNVAALPTEVQHFLERYGYRTPEFPGFFVIETDNGRFMNHCEPPNVEFIGQRVGYATRTIEAGDELTCDYNALEPGFKLLPPLTIKMVTRPARVASLRRANRHGATSVAVAADPMPAET